MMTLPHCTKIPQRKALGLVTHDNTGGPFLVECQGCGEVYPSFHCLGGEQIADTGDHEDAHCPHCDQIDPEECDNAGLAWNTQQLKINALQERLNAADQRNDELSGMLQHLVDHPFRFTTSYRERIAATLKGETADPAASQPITEQFIEDHLGKRQH